MGQLVTPKKSVGTAEYFSSRLSENQPKRFDYNQIGLARAR